MQKYTVISPGDIVKTCLKITNKQGSGTLALQTIPNIKQSFQLSYTTLSKGSMAYSNIHHPQLKLQVNTRRFRKAVPSARLEQWLTNNTRTYKMYDDSSIGLLSRVKDSHFSRDSCYPSFLQDGQVRSQQADLFNPNKNNDDDKDNTTVMATWSSCNTHISHTDVAISVHKSSIRNA